MSEEPIDPQSIRAGTPDWQEGYEQGLLSGYTKSICLIRHLQRTLPLRSKDDPYCSSWQSLEEAMELIAENIEPNNDLPPFVLEMAKTSIKKENK